MLNRTVLVRVATEKMVYGLGAGVKIGSKYILTVKHLANPKGYQSAKDKLLGGDKHPLTYAIGQTHPDNRWFSAKLVALAKNQELDLALLEIQDERFQAVSPIPVPSKEEALLVRSVCMSGFPVTRLPPSLGDPGYSGSALVFTETGQFCGVVKEYAHSNTQLYHCESVGHFVPWVNGILSLMVPPHPLLWNWE
eukprot:gene12232-14326_t